MALSYKFLSPWKFTITQPISLWNWSHGTCCLTISSSQPHLASSLLQSTTTQHLNRLSIASHPTSQLSSIPVNTSQSTSHIISITWPPTTTTSRSRRRSSLRRTKTVLRVSTSTASPMPYVALSPSLISLFCLCFIYITSFINADSGDRSTGRRPQTTSAVPALRA
jgi:hypothetical protein